VHEHVERLPGASIAVDEALLREFEACLTDTATLAFRVAYSVLRQREDAEDVAQDAFVRAYARFAQLRDRGRFRAWLVRLTFRLALDRQRAVRRRGNLERAAGEPPAPGPSASNVDPVQLSRLWDAIDALPHKLRWPIVLSAIHGHDVKEVAALLGVPEGTVKSRLFLARRRLKEQLR
jgi:RNA polymerase sigma-70 factor (ECF subfamily)